ncbi:hypothetical protein [Paraburkholderia sp. MM5384-R2]|uniref:hypothetical protein n=1 Tax=Paraburkholderia sp. MM5384-R2 TaxID=2723097 RepID=UPI001615EF1F|nr:hypothetical protein [Paraburkholderia sp. MM5384-R2]MBB5503255.1 hypothetical protein [Paraburkholderia sp. MM5384-R2]
MKGASLPEAEDSVGGFSEPPLPSMYDFRKQPPVVLSISNALNLNEVRWTDDNVFLTAAEKWYTFSNGFTTRYYTLSLIAAVPFIMAKIDA